jgi:hypothetical protein
MNKLLTLLVASTFALSGATAFAADPPKAAAPAATPAAALQKPADVTAEAWAKMSDADKAKAVEKAKTAAPAKAAEPEKKKKGGC